MLEVSDERVYIEYCIDCPSHQWSTKHDEEKYYRYYKTCKDEIMTQHASIAVYANQVPPGFKDLLHKKNSFPRLGAFEVYYRGNLVFSKLQCGLWPHPKIVAKKIKEIQEDRKKPIRETSKSKLGKARRNTRSTVGTRRKLKITASDVPSSPNIPVIRKSFKDMNIQTEDINLPPWRDSFNQQGSYTHTQKLIEITSPEKDSFFITDFKNQASESPAIQITATSLNSPIIGEFRRDHPESEEPGYNSSQYEDDYEDEEKEEITKLQKELEDELQNYGDSFESEEEANQDPDYESEFEEEATEREVTKTYEIDLPINKTTSKKIPYANNSDEDCEFMLIASDPTCINLKENLVTIPAQQKGKFQLKFAPIETKCERRYLLYIDRNGEAWECIELIARYS